MTHASTPKRRRARGFAAALFALLACGEPPAPPPAETPARPDRPPQPTPDQEKALAASLHIDHLEAEEDPSKCRDCHAIEGHQRGEPTHRCLRCHEENTSAVHASVANEQAHECLTCHDFMAESADAWSCSGCHTEAEDRATPLASLPDAPEVVVHAEEACSSCHVPHGEEPVELGSCVECHEEQSSEHHAKELSDPEQCAECHGGHEEAAAAKTSCATCHAEDVDTEAALFEGHDDCLSCHTPHGRQPLVACESCHEDTRVLGAAAAVEHAECTSCHNPHRPRVSARDSCVGCHDDVASKHPVEEHEGDCVGCHPSHPFRGRLVFAKSCVVCHDEAATETSFHVGAECRTCHEPHGFGIERPREEACRECHADEKTAKAQRRRPGRPPETVKPVEGHTECYECHEDGHHQPDADPVACRTCHEPQHDSITTGHENCLDCHAPHEGTVEAQCAECHETQLTSRHVTDGRDCESCHRSHGPEGPSAPRACGECHTDRLPLLHNQEGHETCGDCHNFHDKAPRRARSTCLGECHQDMVDHEASAKSCVGCHPFETDVPVDLRPATGASP